MNAEDMNFFLGHGHAKGRNTIMYYAIKYKMDCSSAYHNDKMKQINDTRRKRL